MRQIILQLFKLANEPESKQLQYKTDLRRIYFFINVRISTDKLSNKATFTSENKFIAFPLFDHIAII